MSDVNAFVFVVTISAGSGIGFKGFLVQAWDPSEIRIGSFTPGDGMRFLNCSKFKSIADEVGIALKMARDVYYNVL